MGFRHSTRNGSIDTHGLNCAGKTESIAFQKAALRFCIPFCIKSGKVIRIWCRNPTYRFRSRVIKKSLKARFYSVYRNRFASPSLVQDNHTRRCHHPNFAPCQSVLTQCRLAHKREASAPPLVAIIVCFRFSFYPHEVPPIPLVPSGRKGDWCIIRPARGHKTAPGGVFPDAGKPVNPRPTDPFGGGILCGQRAGNVVTVKAGEKARPRALPYRLVNAGNRPQKVRAVR